ncbi:MAG: hypothetical protein K8U57_32360 [Planctomycetes bacterium]|nr:hypothetical protein [Planctomycetota bacterium]
MTGFVVRNLDGAIRATEAAVKLDRHRIRQVFEKRFLASRMAEDYQAIYEQLVLCQTRLQGRTFFCTANGNSDRLPVAGPRALLAE